MNPLDEHCAYLLPLPSSHRTEWGEAFVLALEKELQMLRPSQIDRVRSGTSATRGGQLVVQLIHATAGERVQVAVWEDEARVFYDRVDRTFRVTTRQPDWIDEAVAFVLHLLRGEVEVERGEQTYVVVGPRRTAVAEHRSRRTRKIGRGLGPHPDTWRSASYL